jgi:acid phosphatase (class A)
VRTRAFASIASRSLLFLLSAASAPACLASEGTAVPPISLDAIRLLGPPPLPGSDAEAADRAGVRQSWTVDRIAQAKRDTEFDAFLAFSPVLGETFAAAAFPATNRVFEAVGEAMGAPLSAVKAHWARKRPFVIDPALPTCVAVNDDLRNNGAYPSGHAVAGWAWALILAELLPERADALLQRGREFGESRVVCGLHWPSDNVASQVFGAALLARLRGDAAFRSLVEAARAEFALPPRR